MANRFYCPLLSEAGSVILDDSEAHHLIHVLRGKVGETVELFNGAGLVATCRIESIRKRDVLLEATSVWLDPVQTRSLTLATAVPKGDRFDWLIEKATELGVSRYVPIITERSIVEPRAGKLDKLRSVVVAACKQSKRNHLMEITPLTRWSDALQIGVADHRRLIAHPQGKASSVFGTTDDNLPTIVFVGPEGGFSEIEIQTAIDSGVEPIQLGHQILRIETAAIAIASKLLF